MAKYIATVKTNNVDSGVFSRVYDTLGDDLREWAAECAKTFRASKRNHTVTLVVLRNGDALGNAREFPL